MARKTTNNNTANIGFEAKLWLPADKLRNNMDAAEYKHVVLGLIFLKYISDTFEEHRARLVAGKGGYEAEQGPKLAPIIDWSCEPNFGTALVPLWEYCCPKLVRGRYKQTNTYEHPEYPESGHQNFRSFSGVLFSA